MQQGRKGVGQAASLLNSNMSRRLCCHAHLASNPTLPPSAHVAGISQLLGFLCLEVMSRMTGMVVTVIASSLVCNASKGRVPAARRQRWVLLQFLQQSQSG